MCRCLLTKYPNKNVIVLTPASLVSNYEKELDRVKQDLTLEIFDKIKYLCSFLAKYVTGSSINLDHRNFLILNQFKPVEALEIKQFESEIGTNLNMEYKTFLLESNGGNPVRNVFSIPNQGQDSIKMLYGLNSNSNNYDLRKQFLQFKHENSGQFLPIAEDGFGNQICLGLFENCSGKIYFWDRDIGENILIADSFDGFIKKLVKN